MSDALAAPLRVRVVPEWAHFPEAVVEFDLGSGWTVADLTTPTYDALAREAPMP